VSLLRFFEWLGTTSWSVAFHESRYVFLLVLMIHVLTLSVFVGTALMIDLRLLGLANRVPLPELAKFYPVMWAALALNFASGTLLLIGYPYKAFTNPLFYVKLSLIAIAVYLAVRIRNQVLLQPNPDVASVLRMGRRMAAISLACWAGVILAGRLLAYTYTWLRVGMPNNF